MTLLKVLIICDNCLKKTNYSYVNLPNTLKYLQIGGLKIIDFSVHELKLINSNDIR